MRLLRKILLPFSLLYAGVTSLRNKMYDHGILKSQSYPLPIICVGNLSVGGTGKTPMIEYLITLLSPNYNIATLSRGYKRESKGFYLLQGSETAAFAGDEPLQFKKKFPEISVAVDEQRQHGIEKLLKIPKPPQVILLDDAFQHRKVKPGLNILLTSYGDLYADDYVLPTGNLRESRSGASRAQLVVVTKCPTHLKEGEREAIRKKLDLEPHQKLFFCGIEYGENITNGPTSKPLNTIEETKYSLVTGIANPKPFTEYLISLGHNFEHFSYPDHHNFRDSEIEELRKKELLLTTEKDFMRLKGRLKPEQLYYLPMHIVFLPTRESLQFAQYVEDFTGSAVANS